MYNTGSLIVALAACLGGTYGSVLVKLPEGCPLDNCLHRTVLPAPFRPAASAFCSGYLKGALPVTTKTALHTNTVTVTATPSAAHVTETSWATATATANTVCLAGSVETVAFPTTIYYISRPATTQVVQTVVKRDIFLPPWFNNGCNTRNSIPKKISSACSCFLGTKTATVSRTQTSTVTVTQPTRTNTAVISSTTTTTTTVCTSTSPSVTTASLGSCGTTFTELPTASTSGSITCPSTAAAPSTNSHLRIEAAGEGTLFEGCVVAGPRSITTSSGGTHICDGTNNGVNPFPGNTPTDQLDAASKLNGFSYDGTFQAQESDFFITSISTTSQTSSQFWGLMLNGQFSPVSGCQQQVENGDRTLWAFDAFNMNSFLKVSPDYAVAQAGSGTVTVTITDDSTGQPIQGAVLGGVMSDSSGHVSIPVPARAGCYQMKASKNSALRSNAFYLAVVDHFAGVQPVPQPVPQVTSPPL